MSPFPLHLSWRGTLFHQLRGLAHLINYQAARQLLRRLFQPCSFLAPALCLLLKLSLLALEYLCLLFLPSRFSLTFLLLLLFFAASLLRPFLLFLFAVPSHVLFLALALFALLGASSASWFFLSSSFLCASAVSCPSPDSPSMSPRSDMPKPSKGCAACGDCALEAKGPPKLKCDEVGTSAPKTGIAVL
ncbi:hypothetical protein K437DRAFT_78195 [Tilletiaria anomala UBC 951]|uniref:Uncharacterized protein n=1 Tax=Tilletiaria anomala (strain ATCC 24038 / CBS 436.72 / UBC 951) TaxID=1037660 RepID=A0A066V1Y4_TILAU|nr:uncharacterized protein K437DRAFT_78195 [Tilletiaria anomala UBC 951]KDN35451.1 hypothetical protein K437DRAFT_78195 [Tilletiaria anomala UBC 951]